MRKGFYGFLAIVILMSMCAGAFTIKAATFDSPIAITEYFPNPKGQDIIDFMEIVNISDQTIDLYDYMLWGGTANSAEDFKIEDVFRHNYFTDARGQYTLAPGQFAILFVVTSEHYKNHKYAKPDGSGNVTYYLDDMLALIESKYGKDAKNLSNAIIVLMDRTLKNDEGTLNADGLGYANSKHARYFIARRDERPENALCWIDIPEAAIEDICYNFVLPDDGTTQMKQFSVTDTPTYGFLLQGQVIPMASVDTTATTTATTTTSGGTTTSAQTMDMLLAVTLLTFASVAVLVAIRFRKYSKAD